jgi:hypothetical protein
MVGDLREVKQPTLRNVLGVDTGVKRRLLAAELALLH